MGPASRGGRVRFAGAVLVAAMLVPGTASAHRLDEYLQAARIDVEPSQVTVDLDLTPGVDVAGSIIEEIDRDDDGALSAAECEAYAAQVLNGIVLEADGRGLNPRIVSTQFPEVDAIRRGEGTIRLRIRVELPTLSSGHHEMSFRNRHRRDISVYAANALVPESERIRVRAQRREGDQSALTISYDVGDRGPGFPWWPTGLAGCLLSATLVVRRRASLGERPRI